MHLCRYCIESIKIDFDTSGAANVAKSIRAGRSVESMMVNKLAKLLMSTLCTTMRWMLTVPESLVTGGVG